MSLAVPLRLIALVRLPLPKGTTPKRPLFGSRPIDPCAIGDYMRRDIGLQDFPCSPDPAERLLRIR